MTDKKTIELKVAEAMQNDVGRGVVRLGSQNLERLKVSSGDIIAIEGAKKTPAIVWQAHPGDEGLDIIRMDGLLRQNSQSSLGDKVKVSKAEFQDAKKITIAPVSHQIAFGADFANHVKQRILMGRPVVLGDHFVISVLGQSIPFKVAATSPKDIVQVGDYTEIEVKEKPVDVTLAQAPAIRYEDIGGLKDEISKVREMIELPMKHPELFEKLGIQPPKGVLLFGPPGTGKTLLAKAVASETNAYFIALNGPEIMDKFYGESERKLREIFEEAQENSPAIIFIDEMDSIAPKREETKGEVERRVVAQLLTLMDGLMSRGEVVVIAATNRVDAIDPALRRPGRFDREIEIGVPDRDGRLEVLQIHTRGMPLAKDIDLKKIANSTHGFVGADLAALSREAAMSTLKRILPDLNLEKDEIPAEVLENLEVTKDDLKEALKSVQPSALREVFLEVPRTKWADIGGLDKVKQEMKEVVEWPLKHAEAFERMGIRPPKAVLLYGPPGCGKTLMAKAVATESEANFITVKGPELLSKWVGESEKAVREIFKKARQTAPTIIFFDEIDAIAPIRSGESGTHAHETVVNQILTELDGVESLENVIVLGSTNRQELIDPSLLRPGRFDRQVLIPPPDEKSRAEIFKIHTKNMPLTKDVNIKDLAKRTNEFSGADIEGLCREAAMLALRENIRSKQVSAKHFNEALKEAKPSVSKYELKRYKEKGKGEDKELGPAYS
ncbi:MAG: CDC48 family AAA ATPase [Candidatus Altiarchaeota archaeon]